MTDAGEQRIDGVDLDRMRSYLAETDVVFAILFGSHASGTARESSDVDIALRFPATMSDHERFDARNRIDADLQAYADRFVDVSDVDSLPTAVAHAALRDGITLVGDEAVVEAYREDVEATYEATADERERERQEFIDRLAQGDT
jgi:predicted nucleotidyltransferase